MAVLSTMAALSRPRTKPVAAIGRFINQKRNGQRSPRFRLRVADFILSHISSLSAAGQAIFIKDWQSEWPLYQGRPSAVAVVSKPMAVLSRPASLDGRFINNGRFVKAEDQASGRNGRFINQKRPNGQIS
ncbi:MAG: hypothetical protein NXI25_26275 [bacterium]|nr:hypothetical protein [bacterium]